VKGTVAEFGHHKFELKATNSGQIDYSDESKCLENIDADLFKGVKFLWKGVINNQKKWKNAKGEDI